MADYGSHGRGIGGWFGPGANGAGHGGWGLPWGRGGGVVGASGERETLAAVMARRAPPPPLVRRDAVRAAEAAAAQVVARVHPTQEAERRRQDVIDYLNRLIGTSVGCEVFTFGSVPLKTYLPDGDVDITVLGNTWLHSTFLDEVRRVLESEQENSDAEFKLTGLNFINAEVKLIKCVVENIVVDISFNQTGGVSTFCFLELVDRQVGKNHLFKRSIMLIKAWCYHESRILGAHHGLISTYALETLVLYIFNMFHKSLHGPLEALYRFLEYYSKFDWDRYGISLNGHVLLSSLPDLVVEATAGQDESLLCKDFLRSSLDRLLVISNEHEGCETQIRVKYLNIIDPLKGNNNLGRSVSKASFYRIRSAFSFGAQRLGQILMSPCELIPDEICGVFENTLKSHGKGERPDLGDLSSFQSLFDAENVLPQDGSNLKGSCMNEVQSRSLCHPSNLADKDSYMVDVHNTSEKKPLTPFSQSSMLDLSGDLDLHLGCLRKVQYHLESLFDELLQAVQEACLAGVLDEDLFKVPTGRLFPNTDRRPPRLSLALSTDNERRKLSPVYCSNSTGDVSQEPNSKAQMDVVGQQNVALSNNGSPSSSSSAAYSDNYHFSLFCLSPRTKGTGTYIPKVSYYMYKERMAFEREIARGRKQRERLPDRQYYSLEQGYSGPEIEHPAVQSATSQSPTPTKQSSSQQDAFSSKSSVPREAIATDAGTKQVVGRNFAEKGRQTKPPSSGGVVLPHSGQGNPPVSNICQLSSPATAGYSQLMGQVAENLEFGSFGPFSLGLLSAKFEEAFPALPTSKRPAEVPPPVTKRAAEVPSPATKRPAEAPGSTMLHPKPVAPQSRPKEGYQLRDEADFPPLQAGCR